MRSRGNRAQGLWLGVFQPTADGFRRCGRANRFTYFAAILDEGIRACIDASARARARSFTANKLLPVSRVFSRSETSRHLHVISCSSAGITLTGRALSKSTRSSAHWCYLRAKLSAGSRSRSRNYLSPLIADLRGPTVVVNPYFPGLMARTNSAPGPPDIFSAATKRLAGIVRRLRDV